MIETIKHIYRSLVPERVRHSKTVSKLKSRLLAHHWIYDSAYYRSTVEGPAARSAPTIAEQIVTALRPRAVLDVGCGTGALLAALRERGCEVYGLEYSDAALRYCRARGLEVSKFNLEKDIFEPRKFDVAVSMEVAEHLPQEAADRYVFLLTQAAPFVVFTAAPPGQGGIDHVNEQPPSYWIRKFQDRGFQHVADLSKQWADDWKASGNVQGWYCENLMLFRRAA